MGVVKRWWRRVGGLIVESIWFFFFFQAEDGIRDKLVTGVQTCALPISRRGAAPRPPARPLGGPVSGVLAIVRGGCRDFLRRGRSYRSASLARAVGKGAMGGHRGPRS